MLTIVAAIKVKPGKMAEFENIVAELTEASRSEAGNVSYNFYRDLDDENGRTFIENWRSQAAFEFHLKTPHFLKAAKQMADCREGESEIHRYADTGL